MSTDAPHAAHQGLVPARHHRHVTGGGDEEGAWTEMACRLRLCPLMLCHRILCHLRLCHLMFCHIFNMSSYLLSSYVMSAYVISSHVMSSNVMSPYVMSSYLMSSYLIFYLSPVTCHMSKDFLKLFYIKKKKIKKIIILKKIGQSGVASRWKVCYQRGLPRLVSYIAGVSSNS